MTIGGTAAYEGYGELPPMVTAAAAAEVRITPEAATIVGTFLG